ncbi:MAG: hypothetical protein L3J47_02880 [Sulfurovum sp.]|nr:hypothetical protein [Sulfurovum sp.]
MQNRYVGDVGDFGKFQLFRFLFNHHASAMYGKTLAQIWFMHSGAGEKNNDGRHIDYFERMNGSDAFLEHSLMNLLMEERREVEELERLKLLPNAKFFYDEVPRPYEDRQAWFERALWFAHKSDVVAVAPDNGMALRCLRSEGRFEMLYADRDYRQKVYPQKYIFADEIGRLFSLPSIEVVIVYQHLGRCMSHTKQIATLKAQLKETYPFVTAIKHTPYSPRVFFFLCKSEIILENVHYRLEQFVERFGTFWQLPD